MEYIQAGNAIILFNPLNVEYLAVTEFFSLETKDVTIGIKMMERDANLIVQVL